MAIILTHDECRPFSGAAREYGGACTGSRRRGSEEQRETATARPMHTKRADSFPPKKVPRATGPRSSTFGALSLFEMRERGRGERREGEERERERERGRRERKERERGGQSEKRGYAPVLPLATDRV